MHAPFFQCPRCNSVDVVACVANGVEREGLVLFLPTCSGCGLSAQGPLVDPDEPAFRFTLFGRWLHPSRRERYRFSSRSRPTSGAARRVLLNRSRAVAGTVITHAGCVERSDFRTCDRDRHQARDRIVRTRRPLATGAASEQPCPNSDVEDIAQRPCRGRVRCLSGCAWLRYVRR